MQKFILILFSLLCFNLEAQETSHQQIPISIAYWGYNAFHPGIKVGSQLNLRKWDKTKKRKKGTRIKHKTLFLKPALGIYHHKENHTGILLNSDFGIETSKSERKFFKTFSFGLGYASHFNSGITYILEEDNTISEKKWASRGYIMPSLNFGYGQNFQSFSWFNKFSVGSKLKYNTGNSLELFFEAGVKFYPFNFRK